MIKRSPDDSVTYSNFRAAYVDGSLLGSDDFTFAPGSLIIDLKSSYLDGLETGSHVLRTEFTDGTVSADFSVTEKEEDKDDPDDKDDDKDGDEDKDKDGDKDKDKDEDVTPDGKDDKNDPGTDDKQDGGDSDSSKPGAKTGDGSDILMYLMIMFAAAAAGCTVLYRARARR